MDGFKLTKPQLKKLRLEHKVKEFLQKNRKIELVFLPAYSPFLNLIERVWKYFSQMVMYNK